MSGTIPFTIFELILTLADRELCAESNVGNQFGVFPTQALLFWCDRFYSVSGRKLKIIVVLRLRWTIYAEVPKEKEGKMGLVYVV